MIVISIDSEPDTEESFHLELQFLFVFYLQVNVFDDYKIIY